MARHAKRSSAGRAATRLAGAAAVPIAGIALAAPAYASSSYVQAVQTVPSAAAHETATETYVMHQFHERHLLHEQHLRDDATVSYQAPVKTDSFSSGAILSPAQIGALWLEAGGSPLEELTAECIAHFESGGNTDAISPTDDWGVWQINASHGPAMATLNPLGNAEAAIAISDDGQDWGAWTTAWHCV